MTEKELGESLLQLDMAPAPAAPDPRQLTRMILARDRRRVHLLATLATGLWTFVAVGVGALIAFYFLLVVPRLNAYAAGRVQPGNDWDEWLAAGDITARIALGCLAAFLAAAVCTVHLVAASRRATLRQINASLVEISEQLKQLRQPTADQRPGPAPP